jgi:serine/threonine protein phosphatase PrpC
MRSPEPGCWAEASCLTDRGPRREHDPGRALVSRRLGLAAVACGMGGSGHAGVLGAEAVVDALGEWVAGGGARAPAGDAPEDHPAVAALRLAHERIRALHAGDRRHQGISAVAALVVADGRDRAVVAHAGDVRVFRLRGGRLEALTTDHSLLEAARRPGSRHTPAQAASLPAVVTRALGLGDDAGLEVRRVERQPGDLFVLRSHGLGEALSDDDLVSALTWRDRPPRPDLGLFTAPTLAETCMHLVAQASRAGGPHAVAVALARG